MTSKYDERGGHGSVFNCHPRSDASHRSREIPAPPNHYSTPCQGAKE